MSLKKMMKFGAVAALSAYGGSESVFEVGTNCNAILVSLGRAVVKDKVYGEGRHYKLPWFQSPVIYHASRGYVVTLKFMEDEYKETQQVKLRIVTSPVPDHLPNLCRQVGDNYDWFMLTNIQKVLSDVVSKFTAKQVLGKEEVILEMLEKSFAERLDGLNISVDLSFKRD